MKTQFDEAEGALTSDSTQDNAINPDLERFMAKRIGAQTREIKASHVGLISQPAEIAKVIEAAAGAK